MLLFLNFAIHYSFKILKMPFRLLFKKINNSPTKTQCNIDVVIPLIAKDIKIAQICVQSLKKYSLNPVQNIFIVSPADSQIIDFCTSNQLKFIDEDSILPISKEEIKKLIKQKNRVGWFIQQLIKLNSETIPNLAEKYLVFDADTVLCQKQFFYNEKFTVLKFSDEFHFLYRLTNYKILKKVNLLPVSFIAHHMVFEKSILISLKKHIQHIHTENWFNVILDKGIDNNYFFSEYELYAQYVLAKFPARYKKQYWFNNNNNFDNHYDINIKGSFYQSISYHNYSGYEK